MNDTTQQQQQRNLCQLTSSSCLSSFSFSFCNEIICSNNLKSKIIKKYTPSFIGTQLNSNSNLCHTLWPVCLFKFDVLNYWLVVWRFNQQPSTGLVVVVPLFHLIDPPLPPHQQGALAPTTATSARTAKKRQFQNSKTTTLPSVHDYDVRLPNFTFY